MSSPTNGLQKMPHFVDPRPLYETEAPLSSRVDAFRRHLVVDSASQELFRDVTQEIVCRSPVADIGCGVGVPLLPVGPTVMDGPIRQEGS